MDVLEKYKIMKPKYEKLGFTVVEIIKDLLHKNNIDVLLVYYRTKEEESFLEKIERKEYKNPFKKMEDLSAMRVICYYDNDIELVESLIKNNFKTKKQQRTKKSELINPEKFGYRSVHLIAEISNSWKNKEKFKELNGLKIEIQIRTILMHAWAEIEHKLAYKKKESIAPPLRRKFSQLSAILELGDEQFQLLKDHKNKYQKSLLNSSHLITYDFSVDSLEVFLNSKFDHRKGNTNSLSNFYQELKTNHYNLKDIENGIDVLKKKKLYEEILLNAPRSESLTKIGVAILILDITSSRYWELRKKNIAIKQWKEHVLKYQKKTTHLK